MSSSMMIKLLQETLICILSHVFIVVQRNFKNSGFLFFIIYSHESKDLEWKSSCLQFSWVVFFFFCLDWDAFRKHTMVSGLTIFYLTMVIFHHSWFTVSYEISSNNVFIGDKSFDMFLIE